ncbi:hypothetical protein J4464_00175 [Candidatus Woesearchaeota archaeon]|nr:hypothetical protein [Candidatus Woesearchaeota archaeon]
MWNPLKSFRHAGMQRLRASVIVEKAQKLKDEASDFHQSLSDQKQRLQQKRTLFDHLAKLGLSSFKDSEKTVQDIRHVITAQLQAVKQEVANSGHEEYLLTFFDKAAIKEMKLFRFQPNLEYGTPEYAREYVARMAKSHQELPGLIHSIHTDLKKRLRELHEALEAQLKLISGSISIIQVARDPRMISYLQLEENALVAIEKIVDVDLNKIREILADFSIAYAHDAAFAGDGERRRIWDQWRQEGMVFVHMTNYFPHHAIITSTISAQIRSPGVPVDTARDTIHFTVNGPVLGHMEGDWAGYPVGILIPGKMFPLDRLASFARFDSWIFGNLKIPAGSVIICEDQILQAYAKSQNSTRDQIIATYYHLGIHIYVPPQGTSAYHSCRDFIKNSQYQYQAAEDGTFPTDTKYAQSMGIDSGRHAYYPEADLETLPQSFVSAMRIMRQQSSYLASGLLNYSRYEVKTTPLVIWGTISACATQLSDARFRRVIPVILSTVMEYMKFALPIWETQVSLLRECLNDKVPVSSAEIKSYCEGIEFLWGRELQYQCPENLRIAYPNTIKAIESLLPRWTRMLTNLKSIYEPLLRKSWAKEPVAQFA